MVRWFFGKDVKKYDNILSFLYDDLDWVFELVLLP